MYRTWNVVLINVNRHILSFDVFTDENVSLSLVYNEFSFQLPRELFTTAKAQTFKNFVTEQCINFE